MKFKYFLRGLGVGIVFASILFLTAYRDNLSSYKLTDDEIIKRAKSLGMVEADSKIGSLLNEHDNTSETVDDTKPEQETSVEPDTRKEATEITETTQPTEEQADSASGQTGENDGDSVEITIERGLSSYPVCQKLQELGIIESAEEFDTYLVKNGYADRMKVGTHKLTKGMDFKTIAETISDPQ